MTHWTGTTVDFSYFAAVEPSRGLSVVGTYVVYSDLSDHLPVVTDISFAARGDAPAPLHRSEAGASRPPVAATRNDANSSCDKMQNASELR